MGTVLQFYVPSEDFLRDPGEFDWDLRIETRLRMVCKHDELQRMLFNDDAYMSTGFVVDREICHGQIAAGSLARCLGSYFQQEVRRCPEEAAISAHIAALPSSHLIVVELV